MSKTKQKTPNTITYTATGNAPTTPHIKTAWELENLYYTKPTREVFMKDVAKAARAYRAFAKKWRGVAFETSTKTLRTALQEYEALQNVHEASKPARYLSLRLALNVNDDEAHKEISLLSQKLRKLSNELLFFPLQLGAIPKTKQKELLKTESLKNYRYFLSRIFLEAQYYLTEAEEKIINLKSAQASDRWVEMTSKIISNRTVTWNKQQLPIPEALERVNELPTQDKPKLWHLLMQEMEQIAEVAEHEFNAIITDDHTENELRGYKKPYSPTAIAYEDTEKSIENLVETVTKQGFALSRKFYKAKAEYHGVDSLHYSQKYDSIGTDLRITFKEAVAICRDVFYSVNTSYGECFDNMLTNGQIDVYPKKGKQGGAFMSSQTGHPIQVFLNHVDNFKSLETLAHEMGHAIHAERSAQNSPLYDGHSITTAETASTLFENLVFDAVYTQASEQQKLVLLHDRITRDIATIQRQVTFFNAELEIHTTIAKNGAMTKEELRACMQKHLQAYLGKHVEIRDEDGYGYVYIPHLRYGFYVYTYSFGLLMSTIMADKYQNDSTYAESIDTFLSAGASDTVANIFKRIGIDTTKADTYSKALANQAKDINRFVRLVKKQS